MSSLLSPLRAEVQALFTSIPCRRRPALRRAREAEWLFASDLPLVAEDLASACALLTASGWRWVVIDGWIRLDCLPERMSEAPQFPAPPRLDGEAACIARLLRIHPVATDATALRALLKADDEGSAALERHLIQLHGLCAERLRLHQPLPDLLPWLVALSSR